MLSLLLKSPNVLLGQSDQLLIRQIAKRLQRILPLNEHIERFDLEFRRALGGARGGIGVQSVVPFLKGCLDGKSGVHCRGFLVFQTVIVSDL